MDGPQKGGGWNHLFFQSSDKWTEPGAWSLQQPRLLTQLLHNYVMFCVPRTRKRSEAPPLAHTAAH